MVIKMDILGDRQYFRCLTGKERSSLERALEDEPDAKGVVDDLLQAYERTCERFEEVFKERMKLAEQAETDNFGFQNERVFRSMVEGMIRVYENRQERTEKETFSVVEIDLSEFKSVNDEYGDGAGNYVIRNLPEKLGEELRRSDLFYHPHGDTFYILMLDTDEEGADTVLSKIKKLQFDIPKDFTLTGKNEEVEVGLHTGIIQYEYGDDINSMRKKVNGRLLRDKKRNKSMGKNET